MWFRPIIAKWASEASAEDAAPRLAADIGLPAKNVRRWVDLDSIPADWFLAVARAADTRGIEGATVDDLAEIAERRRLARAPSAQSEAAA